ncbi:MAG: bS21 family ribosomal protein [Rhizonema sp. NSF051]|nr:bS21 family ribosomal protein [Rhizonema sp. NSF051]
MSEIRVGEIELIDSAIRRLKNKIQKAGILFEVKSRENPKKYSLSRIYKAQGISKDSRYYIGVLSEEMSS